MTALAGAVPRRGAAEVACRIAGLAWYVSVPTARAAVHDNLRHVLRRQPTRREVLRVFQHGALNYWDTFAIPHLSRDDLLGLVDMRGLEHLEAAHAAGRGVIVASAHLGSVSLVGQLLPALGYPTLGLLEPIEPPEVYDFFARQRETFGTRLMQPSAAALRELLVSLRQNKVVGLVTDRDITGTGPSIPFFDALARFPDGAASLSLRTGAPIVIGVATRRRDGRFDGVVEPLPNVFLTGDVKRDVLEVTRAVAGRLEYHIASHPDQWTVFQRRWPEAQPG